MSSYPGNGRPGPWGSRRQGRNRAIVGGALVLVVLAGAVAGAVIGVSGGGSVEVKPNSVAVIDAATNKVVADLPAGVQPVGLAVGKRPDAVWLADGDGTVTRIDPEARTSYPPIGVETIPPNAGSADIAAGAGSVWVASNDGSVSRIDIRRSAVVASIELNTDVGAVTAGPAGVWVAGGLNEVIQIDPVTNRVARRVRVRAPLTLTQGLGAIYIIEGTRQGRIVRIDANTGAVQSRDPGVRVSGLAAGAGALWTAGPHTVFRLDPATLRVTRAFSVAGNPTVMAIGAGSLWLKQSFSRVVRLDPRNGKVQSSFTVGPVVSELAFLAGRAWVLVVEPPKD